MERTENNPGLQGLTYPELKVRCNLLIGIYLGCPTVGREDGGQKPLYRRESMLCTPDHVRKCKEMGADFVVLGGNPGSGTSIDDVIACAKWVKDTYGDGLFVFSKKRGTELRRRCWAIPLPDATRKRSSGN